jgi:hypothetical protein
MRRFLPVRALSLVALFIQLCLVPAQADPLIKPHWGACPYGSDPDNIGPGDPRANRITLTVTGLAGTIQAFLVVVRIGTGTRAGIPDAWRFEDGGCEAGHLYINSPAALEPCPQLTGEHPWTIHGAGYYPPAPAVEELYFGASFDPFVADPNETYTLASFHFDRPDVVTGAGVPGGGGCGCFERPLCITIGNSAYLDGDGNTIPLFYSRTLSWNDPANQLDCGKNYCDLSPFPCYFEGDTLCVGSPTAAARRSWGSLKASYR